MKTKFNKTYCLKLTSNADIIKAYFEAKDITSQRVKIATFIVLKQSIIPILGDGKWNQT